MIDQGISRDDYTYVWDWQTFALRRRIIPDRSLETINVELETNLMYPRLPRHVFGPVSGRQEPSWSVGSTSRARRRPSGKLNYPYMNEQKTTSVGGVLQTELDEVIEWF